MSPPRQLLCPFLILVAANGKSDDTVALNGHIEAKARREFSRWSFFLFRLPFNIVFNPRDMKVSTTV